MAVFEATGSINQAAKTNGISHSRARRVLVEQGLVEEDRRPVGKAEAKARFFELLDAGWSASRAAGRWGGPCAHGRDWRDGVRKIGNTRVRPDGVVIRYGTGPAQYNGPMTMATRAEPPVISSRYLSLEDRLAIADGLANAQSMTAIAERIGKSTSTVSREITNRSQAGLYLPYQAHNAAAAARARPKAVQTGHQPAAAAGRRRRAGAAVVLRGDLLSSDQGLPG